jgi:hypothetical protein
MSDGLNSVKGRESAFGDNGTIIPDGAISAGDRQTLVGEYPLGYFDDSGVVHGLAAYFPTVIFRSFAGESKGMSGTGSFSFKVLENEKDKNGDVLVLLSDISFKTENMADRTYKDLIGENANPKRQVDSEDDDTDVA